MELNQVTLPVTNMVEAVEFYLTLGFTIWSKRWSFTLHLGSLKL